MEPDALGSVSGIMHYVSRMRRWIGPVVCGALLAASAAAARADDGRFSQRLPAFDFAGAGLARLSADQLAALDALIRRDEQQQARRRDAAGRSGRFSQRLPADERRVAGLEFLKPTELEHLDWLVAQVEGSGPPTGLAAGSPGSAVVVRPARPAPQIHGELSLTVGAGSGGYQEIGGSLVLEYDDPAHGLTLLTGFSQWRATGGFAGRGCAAGPWPRHAVDAGLPASR